MFIRDLQIVQNWGPCIISDAFPGKYIHRNQSQKNVFSGKNLINSNANIDTKNILQYRVQEKYSTTNYIKTYHRFRSYFPQTAEIMFFFKSNRKASNKEKKPMLSICTVANPEFPGKMACLSIILINKTV